MLLGGLALYNILLNPLALFPGPWYAACSPLWYVVSLFKGTLAFDVQRLHETYGDVVRISPNELSYRQFEAWKDIYGPRDELPGHEMEKDPVRKPNQLIKPIGLTHDAIELLWRICWRYCDYNHSQSRRPYPHATTSCTSIFSESFDSPRAVDQTVH